MKKRQIFPGYCYFLILSSSIFLALAIGENTSTVPVNVGVVLDLDDSVSTKVWLSCINIALSDFYSSHSSAKTRLVLNIRDSKSDVVGAAAAALDLIKNVQVQGIIGPRSSMQANFLIDLGNKAHVPVISFSATSPSLTSTRGSYFFRAAQNDSSQVKAISAIVKAFGWRVVVPIYIDDAFGEGILPSLVEALQEVRARVPNQCAIPPNATNDQLAGELYKLMILPNRVFIVHMTSSLGSRLFAKAHELGMMKEGYVWILTNGLANLISSTNGSVINWMQGALGVRTYVPRTNELIDFRRRWKRQFQQEHPTIIDVELDVFGLWAYDAAYALAKAVENVGFRSTFGFYKSATSSNSSTDLVTLGTSQKGLQLSKFLSHTRFSGMAGDFSFVNGQLQSPIFEFVNVIGNGARGIGFWTPHRGLVKNLNTSKATNSPFYSTSKSDMRPIIWPGDSASIPKGWEASTHIRKLRVVVPVKNAAPEFVKVVRNPVTNKTDVTGFCIDTFNAMMQGLPYAVNYEFIPFAKPDGTTAGNYNDMVYQVFLGNFDAVAASTTIRGNRSLYVDFTLPYTESGVVMVVQRQNNNRLTKWIFFKPFHWKFWLIIGLFFFWIAFVVWVLEHRVNVDFRGNPRRQVATSILFSYSTMVYAHQTVVSGLGRFVVIVWMFVVLVLVQSYGASLSSILTVPQVKPAYTEISELLENKEYVGYPKGSFVHNLLIQRGFDESRIKAYISHEECDHFLTQGSANGGIAAAIDETPNVRLFLAKYCTKYTMVGPFFKTGGFAFVFAKGSPLVSDVSRSILNVTEGDEMKNIESKWFGKTICLENKDPSYLRRFSVDLFWVLFAFSGGSSFLALFIHATLVFIEYRRIIVTCWNLQRRIRDNLVTYWTVWSGIRFMFMFLVLADSPNSALFRKQETHVDQAVTPPQVERIQENVQLIN